MENLNNEELFQKLEIRVASYLSNADELEPEHLEYAINEALDICKNKDVDDYLILDIAYYRFLLLVQKVDDIDLKQYENALKQVNNSKTIDTYQNKKSYALNRKSEWI